MKAREAWLKLGSLFHKEELDRDLESELAAHIDMATEDLVGQGLSPEEARRRALVELGGIEQSKERHREARSFLGIETLFHDLRYAARVLRRDIGFTLFTTLIIALGIGASATVFSVVNTLLVRPLPFAEPERLVWIANTNKNTDNLSGRTMQVVPVAEYAERSQLFSEMGGYFAFYGSGDVSLTGSGDPERLTMIPVTERFFPVLGVKALAGRLFEPVECKSNGPPVTLLSYSFWKRRFAGDRSVVGQGLRLNGKMVTVVGILPESFDFGGIFAPGVQADLFFPFPMDAQTNRMGNTLSMVGRLKPGTAIGAAQAEADVLGDQISAEDTRRNSLHPELTWLPEQVSGNIRPALILLMCAVGIVMLIVCANLSNLMLARTAARQKEMAIRAALGAGQGRLIRQLLTESLLLTSGGAALGMLLAWLATRGVAGLTGLRLPLLSSVQLDWRVVAVTTLVAVVTGLVLGLAPAWQVSKLQINAALSQRTSGGHQNAWLRGTLVVSEMALACVLLVGAGLLVRSLYRVLEVRLGFEPEQAVTLRVDPGPQYVTQGDRISYLNEVLRLARGVPGVDAAGVTDGLPLGRNRTWGAGEKGKSYPRGQYPSAFVHIVSDGYIRAMGMTLVRGRDLDERDDAGKHQVMMINETLAQALFAGENPIGKVIMGDCAEEREVVGVVGDVRHVTVERESGGEIYIPMRQCLDWPSFDLVVRSKLPMAALAPVLDQTLRPLAPNLPKGGMHPVQSLVDRSLSPRRFLVGLLTGFAGFALLLAALGIYGLIAYSVNVRTHEIGVRMALGASPWDVQQRILTRTLGLAGAGMVAGVIAAWLMVKLVSGLLYGVPENDPVTFAGAALVLMGIAGLAGYLPARRASRIDPMICLRSE